MSHILQKDRPPLEVIPIRAKILQVNGLTFSINYFCHDLQATEILLHSHPCSHDIKPIDDCHAELLIFKTKQNLFSKKYIIKSYLVLMEPIFF